MNMLTIRNIGKETFNKYGSIIELLNDSKDGWEIITVEKNAGWRIAVMEFERRSTKTLENHPTSMESFEPLAGISLLIVSENKCPLNFEVFLLDKPVCLYKGIWHQILTISELSRVKITENAIVTSELYHLENELSVCVKF